VDEFHKALLEAVDEALLQLSESVRSSIYWYLESRCNLKRETVPFKLEEFMRGLRGIFGEGVNIILRWIARKLYTKLELTFEEKADWSFIDYVNHAKESMKRPTSPQP
jgi:hypothetical protein